MFLFESTALTFSRTGSYEVRVQATALTPQGTFPSFQAAGPPNWWPS